MAIQINLEKEGVQRKGFVGFSWTTLFFGFFVPLFRGDIKWFLVMLVLNIITCFTGQLILCFFYNKFYTRDLVEKGYRPMDDYSASLLKKII